MDYFQDEKTLLYWRLSPKLYYVSANGEPSSLDMWSNFPRKLDLDHMITRFILILLGLGSRLKTLQLTEFPTSRLVQIAQNDNSKCLLLLRCQIWFLSLSELGLKLWKF